MHLSGGLGVSPPARFPPSLPSGPGPGLGCGRGCVGCLRGDLWVRVPGPSEGAAPTGAACPAGSVGVRVRETRAALDGHVARSPGSGVAGCAQRLSCRPARPLQCPRNGGDSLVLGGRQAQERNRDALGPRRIAQGKPRSSPWVWHRVTELPSAVGGQVCPVPASPWPLLALKASPGSWLCSGPYQASSPQPRRGPASARAHLRFAT